MARKTLKEIPNPQSFTGYLLDGSTKVYECECSSFYEKYNFPEDERIAFKVRPMTATERDIFRSDDNNASVKATLWAKEQGFNLKTIAEMEENSLDFLAFSRAIKTFQDTERRKEVVRNCIVGWNAKPKFPKDKTGCIKKEVFDKLPVGLIEEIEQFIVYKSELGFYDSLGL